MTSMEVYSGVPSEPTMHFEDWMQTQYSGLKSKLSKWANLSDEQKAELFLGQLNSYFEHRNKLLGDDDYYLFPRDRPSNEVLKVGCSDLHGWHAVGWQIMHEQPMNKGLFSDCC